MSLSLRHFNFPVRIYGPKDFLPLHFPSGLSRKKLERMFFYIELASSAMKIIADETENGARLAQDSKIKAMTQLYDAVTGLRQYLPILRDKNPIQFNKALYDRQLRFPQEDLYFVEMILADQGQEFLKDMRLAVDFDHPDVQRINDAMGRLIALDDLIGQIETIVEFQDPQLKAAIEAYHQARRSFN